MISVTFDGLDLQEVAEQARHFADVILGPLTQADAINGAQPQPVSSGVQSKSDPFGYRPQGVNLPHFKPVDDGSEWDQDALEDWVRWFTPDGIKVVKILATGLRIDPRAEAKKLGWTGTYWAGVWTGPRRQAALTRDSRGLRSWPYGHTYIEPRRLWMHPDVAKRVLDLLNV